MVNPDDETVAANPAGKLNGRYRIERRLGEGGLGVVYVACDESLHGRRVVIKMPRGTAQADPWLVERFAREVKALAAVDHPGIVGALDSGVTDEGRPFLVMQYVEGRSLDAIIPQAGLPLDHAGHILQQIGRALAAAHARNICHRDLKPSNVMLQRTAEGGEYVRLIDFGIASVRDSRSQTETDTIVAGTLHYMAPEQLEGRVSAASDIYAFAVIAYELTTGRKPFLANTPLALARMQAAGVSLRPSQLRPDIPAQAERLILQGLAHDARERPRNAATYGDDLARALAHGDDVAGTSGAATLVVDRHAGQPAGATDDRTWISRPVAIAGVCVALLAASTGWWAARYPRAIRGTVPPPQHQTIAETPAAGAPRSSPARVEAAPPTLGQEAPFETQPLPRAGEVRPPQKKAAAYTGPKDGRLVWSGDLEPGQDLDFGSKEGIAGLSGALPGVPVAIEIHPASLQVVTPPSAANGWRRLVIRNEGKKQLIVIVKWTVER